MKTPPPNPVPSANPPARPLTAAPPHRLPGEGGSYTIGTDGQPIRDAAPQQEV